MTYATSQEERTWGMLCHLSAFSWMVGVPFGNIIGPLIVWLVYKDRYPFIDDQGRESLNFQISLTIYTMALIALAVIFGVATLGIGLIIIIPLAIAGAMIIALVKIILVIMAAVSANAGTPYRYPLTIQFF
jgi:hypothetical protein